MADTIEIKEKDIDGLGALLLEWIQDTSNDWLNVLDAHKEFNTDLNVYVDDKYKQELLAIKYNFSPDGEPQINYITVNKKLYIDGETVRNINSTIDLETDDDGYFIPDDSLESWCESEGEDIAYFIEHMYDSAP